MFKHILVPVDGSPTSMLAVSKAAGLAKAFDSAVTVLYVIDLLVMGSHGRRGIEKLVLGSVTQRVLGLVRVPVLVVRD